MTVVLVVDDVPTMAGQYAYDLERLAGYEVLTAGDGKRALDLLAGSAVDCMILDLEMPGMDGFEVLRALERLGNEVPVIVYTGTGNYERCIQAVRLGAYGFIDKAEPMEHVVQEVQAAIERKRLRAEVAALQRKLGVETSLVARVPQLLTSARRSPGWRRSRVPFSSSARAGRARTRCRDLHRLGPFPSGAPFVAINSAALPEHLVESELFAPRARSLHRCRKHQKSCIRVGGSAVPSFWMRSVSCRFRASQAPPCLEERRVTRLGASRSIPVEARVVAATNKDLEAEVAAGRFARICTTGSTCTSCGCRPCATGSPIFRSWRPGLSRLSASAWPPR